MEIFNNREIALLIWSSLALAWCMSKKQLRNGLLNLFIKALPFFSVKVTEQAFWAQQARLRQI